jgi:DNA-binding CsgD family transcriptional regulator
VKAAGITAREYEILRLVGQRLRNREIAERLHVSQRTVETHVSSLLAKTGLPNRIELSKYTVNATEE